MTQEITHIAVVSDSKDIFDYEQGEIGQASGYADQNSWWLRCPCGSLNILTGKIIKHEDGTVSTTRPLHCHGSRMRQRYSIERNEVKWL